MVDTSLELNTVMVAYLWGEFYYANVAGDTQVPPRLGWRSPRRPDLMVGCQALPTAVVST